MTRHLFILTLGVSCLSVLCGDAVAQSLQPASTGSGATAFALRLPSVAVGLSANAVQDDATGTATASPSTSIAEGTYLLSSVRHFEDTELLWPSFLTGTRGFDLFNEPLGNPIYFESPFIQTQLRLFYLWHDFPSHGDIGGGQLNVIGAQI